MNLTRVLSGGLRFPLADSRGRGAGRGSGDGRAQRGLVVGDSVRGSLRHLTLDRLGQIDEVLVARSLFSPGTGEELAAQREVSRNVCLGSARDSVSQCDRPDRALAAATWRRACTCSAARLDFGIWAAQAATESATGDGEIMLNAPLAEELAAKVGDTVVVRFGKADQIPADSPLGRRTDRIATLAELKVIEIIPAEGLGRFGLEPSQIVAAECLCLVGRDAAGAGCRGQDEHDLRRRAADHEQACAGGAARTERVAEPRLEDYGLTLKHVKMTFGEGDKGETIYDYYSLSSERMLLDAAAERLQTSVC